MRNTLILSAAFSLMATTAFAQTGYNVVVEPIAPTVNDIINAPVEYDADGVVKAQYFKADDLSEAEYKALLAEADRVRAYQAANGMAEIAVDAPQVEEPVRYEVEMFSPDTSVTAIQSIKLHTVAKGDTLYNISKRYDASIADIQVENGLTGTALSLGQKIRIPGVMSSSMNTTVLQPIFASAPILDGVVTRRTIEATPQPDKPVIAADTQVYAVLPKDTLYSIARRTCVGVKDLIATNGIANPNALQPGQRLTLPTGHCLAK